MITAHCFPSICHSYRKKNTLSHVYCYPIWKYFYYCDIKYFHFILRMQTKTHFTIIISIKKRRKLKGRVKSDSWTITVKVYNNTQYYTLTQACLTSQSAKYLLEESCDFPLMHFEEEKTTKHSWTTFLSESCNQNRSTVVPRGLQWYVSAWWHSRLLTFCKRLTAVINLAALYEMRLSCSVGWFIYWYCGKRFKFFFKYFLYLCFFWSRQVTTLTVPPDHSELSEDYRKI